GQLFVWSTVGQELVGGVCEQEVDVELGGEPNQLLTRRRRRERGRTSHHTARSEAGPPLFEPRRRGQKLGCVCHEPGQDHHPRRITNERLGHREQGLDTCV